MFFRDDYLMFTSNWVVNSSGVKDSIGPRKQTPAVLIRTSTSGISDIAAVTLSSEVTSSSCTSRLTPSELAIFLNSAVGSAFFRLYHALLHKHDDLFFESNFAELNPRPVLLPVISIFLLIVFSPQNHKLTLIKRFIIYQNYLKRLLHNYENC